ncbi:hypothetical protein AVEN_262715-1, partial [Araneus ventricosus]
MIRRFLFLQTLISTVEPQRVTDEKPPDGNGSHLRVYSNGVGFEATSHLMTGRTIWRNWLVMAIRPDLFLTVIVTTCSQSDCGCLGRV